MTGGNGRGFPGQANVYYLDVPKGKQSLGVGVTLGDPGNEVFATLTAPNAQTYSFNSNVSPDATELENGIQDYIDQPMAGRWVLSLQILNPVSGTVTSSPFKVSIRYNSVSAKAPQLPTSVKTKLKQGQPVTIAVTVSDSSVKQLNYFVDPRLDQVGTLSLAELSGNSTFPLPQPDSVIPFWLVPSHVSSASMTAAADQPVNVDFFWQGGNPDVYASATGNTTTVTPTGSSLTPGIWETDLGQTGPFSGPAPAGTVSVAATAVGQLFDTAVSSTTGDFFAAGVAGQSSNAFRQDLSATSKRLELENQGKKHWFGPTSGWGSCGPTQTTTIMVTITPDAAVGTQVHGHLYIGAVDNFLSNADELIDLPYAYTVQ